MICDITIHNANAFYKLRIRHALRKKRTVMIPVASRRRMTSRSTS